MTGFSDFDSVKKAVIIAAPHTSWHDFHMGILLRAVIGIETNFVGKKALFKFPYGWLFRWLGGSPEVWTHPWCLSKTSWISFLQSFL